MKKNKKILILLIVIIISIIALLIYNRLHYSKEEILAIINRSDENFDNIYIKTEVIQNRNEKITTDEIFAKDNIIYFNSSSNFIPNLDTEIWDLKNKKITSINHTNKSIYISEIEGERENKSSYKYV